MTVASPRVSCFSQKSDFIFILYIKINQNLILIIEYLAVFFDVADYRTMPNYKCSTERAFENLFDAKSSCDLDPNCGGFYNTYGSSSFFICSSPLQAEHSVDGSILYSKGNHYQIRVLIRYKFIRRIPTVSMP